MQTKLVIIFFCWLNLLSGQVNQEQDSLVKVLITAENIDEKFDLNLRLAKLNFDHPEEFENWIAKSRKLAEEINHDSVWVKLYFIEGSVLKDGAETEKGISLLMKSISLAAKIKDSLTLSAANYSIAAFYFWKDNLNLSKKYMESAMQTYPSYGSLLGKSNRLMGYGAVLQGTDLNLSLKILNQSLEIKREINAWQEIPVSLNNIAEIQMNLGDTVGAINSLNESIQIAKKHDVPDAWVYAEFVLGEIYAMKGEYQNAVANLESAIAWWEENNYLKDLPRAYARISDTYKNAGLNSKAIIYFEKLVNIKDSLFKLDQLASIQEMETKYETKKKVLEFEKQKRETELAERETAISNKNKEMQFIVFSIIALLLILNTTFSFYRYKKQKKDKELLGYQKNQLEVRSKEIEDSIRYAKRIQNAILPSDEILINYFPESFVFYKPKDIVAGDFYWMPNNVQLRKDNSKDLLSERILFAVADCTGHGVPGAMVSVVCNSGLNRSVKEFSLKEPGKILDKTREIVIEEFEKSDEDVRDGMDIALISMNYGFDEAKNVICDVCFAGANIPLWYIKKGQHVIHEIKADKQPVGKFENLIPYTTHKIALEKGDIIYLFSDGYIDQFGSSGKANEKPGGKKMKASNFKEILLPVSSEPMLKQKDLIIEAFELWKGDLEQLDDVCVTGIRI